MSPNIVHLCIVVTFITEQTLRKTGHFSLRALIVVRCLLSVKTRYRVASRRGAWDCGRLVCGVRSREKSDDCVRGRGEARAHGREREPHTLTTRHRRVARRSRVSPRRKSDRGSLSPFTSCPRSGCGRSPPQKSIIPPPPPNARNGTGPRSGFVHRHATDPSPRVPET